VKLTLVPVRNRKLDLLDDGEEDILHQWCLCWMSQPILTKSAMSRQRLTAGRQSFHGRTARADRFG
jgi:hypothetical protein